MPQSDTWPGGTGLETMTGMDSAGSCDSVVSANSGFSDDSMEHLSAEEKACLMFLEETIESLDTEEDSGLSNDESDQLPGPGNVATKVADLSASISMSTLNGSPKPVEPTKGNVESKVNQSYLVPTPLLLASSPPCSIQSKLGTSPDRNLFCKPQFTHASDKPGPQNNQKPVAGSVPLEVNVVIPPPTKSKDYSFRTAEGPLPRGPLSYDALVHLRRSASTKKTPLCPTIDHTIEVDKNLPCTIEGQNLKLLKLDRSHSKVSKPKIGPPAVAPKPKKIPANVSVKTQNAASINSDLSYDVKQAPDPQVVRQEALQKLGLLRDQEPEEETEAPPFPPQSNSSMDTSAKRVTRGPSNVNPSRSSLFCDSQLPTEPKARSLQSSTSFNYSTKHDQQLASFLHPAEANKLKAVSLERSSVSGNLKNCRNCPEPQHVTAAEQLKSTAAAQPLPDKPSNSVSYTVMVVPGMGADRKEALRKLGLLKK
ncbi:Specifically androgen-regulated gene protein [Channa argus]|uniref:Specifically androgen-regulated gene protein n=1 Tax=Channa argus TaxID=215402 RepID=A0A6G1PJN0_CHAAH|nr:Specifically androgen-regulated gene protein [Channa argus]KAK2915391.1 hypothetical protein Q8A73_005985 [Channa argus]